MKHCARLAGIALFFTACDFPFITVPAISGPAGQANFAPAAASCQVDHAPVPAPAEAGSFSPDGATAGGLPPWIPGSETILPPGCSFALGFAPEAASLLRAEDLTVDPPLRGQWIREGSLFLFIPDSRIPPASLFTVNAGPGVLFRAAENSIGLLSAAAAGAEGFLLYPPFTDDAVPLTPGSPDGSTEISFQFSGPVEGDRLKYETASRVRFVPLFPPDAPWPRRTGLTWSLDRRLILRYSGLFADPSGRPLLYRLSLEEHLPERDGDPDIAPEGAVLYLRVSP